MVWTRTLRTCAVCGANFPGKSNAEYCKPACKQAMYRIRKLGADAKFFIPRNPAYAGLVPSKKKGR